jgi:hypothetical protein
VETVIVWILAFLTTQAPPSRPSYYPEAQETPAEATARYTSIASDIRDIVYDPAESPLFKGPNGRAQTASIVESIMLHESGFRKDVDYGLGKAGVGDGGTSWCLMQVKLGHMKDGHTEKRIIPTPDGGFRYTTDPTQGFGGEDLISNRKACIQAGLHIVRRSFGACSRMPIKQWLDSYASGSCEGGQDASERRMGLAINWFAAHKPSFQDSDIHVTSQPIILTTTARQANVVGIAELQPN